MPGRLADKIALITGGGSGIGRACALRFAAEGANVGVADLDLAGASETARGVDAAGRKSLAMRVDTTDESASDAMVARCVEALGGVADPTAAFWASAPATTVKMLPQTIVAPTDPNAAVTELSVKAAHDGQAFAFLIEWKDPTESERIVVDQFGDQVAVELPMLYRDNVIPSPMMGNPGARVSIFQWRAAFQHDVDHGDPTVRDLYPNALVDVYPDSAGGPRSRDRGNAATRLGGYQMLVRGDVLRGKFRNGLDKPMPFAPGEPTDVSFTMQAAFHTFQAGHRIMVQVQSTWFPMVDLNPGVFMHIYDAKASDFRSTTQRVYHSAARPSSVEVNAIRRPSGDQTGQNRSPSPAVVCVSSEPSGAIW